MLFSLILRDVQHQSRRSLIGLIVADSRHKKQYGLFIFLVQRRNEQCWTAPGTTYKFSPVCFFTTRCGKQSPGGERQYQ
jgi:hypothetical protein